MKGSQQGTPVLGIMSGTSLDGVDCALCRITERSVRLLAQWQVAFPKKLRTRLERAAQGNGSSYETAQLHHDLGRFYATAVRAGIGSLKPVLIGLHGQTVFHKPPPSPATLQLGEPAYLAEEFRVPVISNFRAPDIAAGGHGAPLATLFHRIVFGIRGKHVCVQNLGGIANVTSLDLRKRERILAFDTGPANLLIDLAVRTLTNGRKQFDRDGAWARRGRVCERFLDEWLKHPFFVIPPPKSTGRELFGEVFLEPALKQMHAFGLSPYDQIATLTEFTARSIRINYERHLPSPPELVVLAGGGALNPALVSRIRAQLASCFPSASVQTCDLLGWPPQTIEPSAFALLAHYRVRRLPGNIPETTGASRPLLLGQITEP